MTEMIEYINTEVRGQHNPYPASNKLLEAIALMKKFLNAISEKMQSLQLNVLNCKEMQDKIMEQINLQQIIKVYFCRKLEKILDIANQMKSSYDQNKQISFSDLINKITNTIWS